MHSVGDGATTIQPNVVANTMLTDMDQATLKGRPSGAGYGDPVDLTAAQARLILNVEDGAEVNNISDANAAALTGGGVTALHSHSGGGGTGDVVGPSSSVDNRIVLFDGITGKLIKDSGKLLSDYVAVALGVTGRMLITDASGNVSTVSNLIYDLTNKIMVQGATSAIVGGANSQELIGDGASAGKFVAALGASVTAFLSFIRGRGTKASPTAIQSGDVIGAVRGRGYYDAGAGSLSNTQIDIEMIATENWSTTARGCKIVISTTPNGSTTKTAVLTIDQDGNINILSGKTYDVNGSPHTHTPAEIGAVPNDGWTAYTAVTPTRTAADDPTYTIRFSGVDLTGVLQEGMPIKWTQNSIVRYGWISSALSLPSGNTSITVLTRLNSSSSNYDVLDTATYSISNFAYGRLKQPGFGFPIDREKWTLLITDTTDRTQSSPTAGTYYQPGSLGITVPIGQWRLGFVGVLSASVTNLQVSMQFILSTTTNSISDGQLAGYQII